MFIEKIKGVNSRNDEVGGYKNRVGRSDSEGVDLGASEPHRATAQADPGSWSH